VLLAVSVTADNDRDLRYMEQALAAILQENVGRLPVSLLATPYRRTAVPATTGSLAGAARTR